MTVTAEYDGQVDTAIIEVTATHLDGDKTDDWLIWVLVVIVKTLTIVIVLIARVIVRLNRVLFWGSPFEVVSL